MKLKFKSTLKYILKLLCCICLMIVPTFMLTACGGYEGPGEQPANPSGGGGDDDVELDDDGNIPDGAIYNTGKFSDYFSGYSALTNADSSLELSDGTSKLTFVKLLDRQIDVLTQDILYRLTYVYGANGEGRKNNKSKKSFHLKYNEKDYKLNNDQAVVSSESLLTTFDSDKEKHPSDEKLNLNNDELNLECLECYQAALNEFSENMTGTGDNYLYNTRYMVFAGAIEGRYTTLRKRELVVDRDDSNHWNWWDSDVLTDSTYDSYISTYKNHFKMAVAEIISGKTGYDVTGVYDKKVYDEMLLDIQNLGYFDYVGEELEEFIRNKVIGVSLISKDDIIYDSISNYVIDPNFDTNAPYSGQLVGEGDNKIIYTDSSVEVIYSPRLYKGYSKIVPAIVKQALANTFEGTTTSLYPYFARVGMTDVNFSVIDSLNGDDVWSSGFIALNKVILKPKAGVKLDGFNLAIDVARKLEDGTLDENVLVDIKVCVEYRTQDKVRVDTSKVLIADMDKDEDGVVTVDGRGYQFKQELEEGFSYTGPLQQYHEFMYDLFPENTDTDDKGNSITGNDTTVELFDAYSDGSNGTSLAERSIFDNVFTYTKGSSTLTYNAGQNYVQITIDIVSAKTVDGVQITNFDDILFDISISPLIVN